MSGRAELPPLPPQSAWITDHDRRSAILYSRMLSTERDDEDWRRAFETLFGVDPMRDEAAARAVWDAYLLRARYFWRGRGS